MWLVVMLYLGRHTERAIDEAQMAIELDPGYGPNHFQSGLALCLARRFDEAIAAMRKAVELTGSPTAQGGLGLALALSGNAVESRALLDRFHTMAARAYVPPTSFAWIHLGLGVIDEAIAWMDKAIDARDHMMTPIKTYPFLDPFRSDPRYLLLREVNLTPAET